MENTDNQSSTQSIIAGDSTAQTVDPGQTEMFDSNESAEQATTMHIAHDDSTYNMSADHLAASIASQGEEEEKIPNSTKIKVLAAIAIVGVAGYIAYWVQEPVQLKADVFSSTDVPANTSSTTSATTDTTTTPADTSTSTSTDSAITSTAVVADAGQSKSVDVSLFGFEPAVMKVDKGTTVIWTNTSTEDQTLIGSSDNGESFTSPVMSAGTSFTFKFETDGTYTYYSTYNPALKATITVGTGVVAAADTTSATTDTSTSSTPAGADLLNAPLETMGTNSAASPTNAVSTNVVSTTSTTEAATTSTEELKGAAPQKLAKTGPAEDMYAVVLLGIAWLNRKKLARIFNK